MSAAPQFVQDATGNRTRETGVKSLTLIPLK